MISLVHAFGDLVYLQTKVTQILIDTAFTWSETLAITQPVKAEWEFWTTHLLTENGMPITKISSADNLVVSDASGKACTASFNPGQTNQEIVVHKMFTAQEAKDSSSYRELAAVLHGLQQAGHLFESRTLLCSTDAKNVVRIVKRGSMIPKLLLMAIQIYNICKRNRITLHITWVPRGENKYADELSCLDDSDDWYVQPAWFQYITHKFQFYPNVDRFASANNTQVPRYNSKFYQALAENTDAFAQDWSHARNWAVPPIYQITRLLDFLPTANCQAIIVFPEWQSSSYWPRFCHFRRTYHKHILNTLTLNNIFAKGTCQNTIFGSNKWASNTLAMLVDFTIPMYYDFHVSILNLLYIIDCTIPLQNWPYYRSYAYTASSSHISMFSISTGVL